MADKKQLREFALKWSGKFKDSNIRYEELVGYWFADDCTRLGFEMDSGKAFSEVYGEAFTNYEALQKVIDDITDVYLLGSAMYSRWRYFNHWAYDPSDILKTENRQWFLIVLHRIAQLSEENPFGFQGTLKKLYLISNNMCYGPMPDSNDEIEQRLTIHSDGRIRVSSYRYELGDKYKRLYSRNNEISKETVDRLFLAFAGYFENGYNEEIVKDVGCWSIELTNTDGKVYTYDGSLCEKLMYKGHDLSDIARKAVGISDLFVFDGNEKTDVLNTIILDYHKSISEKQREYIEQLQIDRKTGKLIYREFIGNKGIVTHTYDLKEEIKELLDDFDDIHLFSQIETKNDVIDLPYDKKDYRITIKYENSPQRILEGSFDQNGLPKDFPYFIELVNKFMSIYELRDIFDPLIYHKKRRRIGDSIFCSVVFGIGRKRYYYLTEDDKIEIGDYVIVPVGKDNHEEIVNVVNIDYFNEENAPFPMDKLKWIIRKCTLDDLDYYADDV